MKLFNLVYSKFLYIANLFRAFIALITERENCVCCNSDSGIYPLCRSCFLKLKLENFSNRCRICGKPLVSEKELCSSCRRMPVLKSLDFCFPLTTYRLWKKTLLFQWKTEDKRLMSPLFAELCADRIKNIFKNQALPVIVPVPPRPGKIRKKGWDQIDELCFYLKIIHGFRVEKVLQRLTTKQQKKMNRISRLNQIHKSYVLKRKDRIQNFLSSLPEKIIIIDDVMTTGSTLEACGEELKLAGVKWVGAVTLFVVD